jgi:glycosyltransferase 2 family protein
VKVPVVAEASPVFKVSPHVTTSLFWKWTVALSLACILLYFALRGVDWRRAANIVLHCRLQYLALACACSALSHVVRAMRWRLLLTAHEKLSPATVLWASSVGYLANNYLPARAGELVRTAMISSRSQLSKTYVFVMAMTERVIELIILVIMASLMSLTLTLKPLWLSRLLVLVTLGTVGGTALLLVLPKIDRGTGFTKHLPFRPGTKNRLRNIAASVTLALTAVRNPLRLSKVCALSAIVWTLDATAAVILAQAIGMRLLFSVALLLSAGLALGNALPSTPGALGIYQFVAITVLMPFNFTQTDAATYILIAQAGSYLVITALGLIGLWRYRASRVIETEVMRPVENR